MLRNAVTTLLLCSAGIALEPAILENPFVRVVVDREHGAVTSLHYKKAISFPYIAEKGAGVAAVGSLFAPLVESGGKVQPVTLTLQSEQRPGVVTLSGRAGGLLLTRTLRLDAGSSAIAIEDSLRNTSAAAVSAGLGGASRQTHGRWFAAERSWAGDTTQRSAITDAKAQGEASQSFA